MSLEKQVVSGEEVSQQGIADEKVQKRQYPAPEIDDVRAKLRKLGVGDPDRLLPSYYWGGFANNT
ncbi:hypothetical protein A3H22_01115 [Candidatus Peribacteria bacterium RIFCSPLOWO2_12_FULL_55_15]|nr:MAG: hypothetical protein A2789_00785 [Candidatus Peribacteria bacterium RIFCSPHIGHO2_01_FULL_54_22]OGJ62437.1 MAG: hypothetical protein A3D12_01465 [Candidatus Peribacteria bacterium RIFCSPHIGHO2_02_FULL_55_24]OGJ68776.1 MAG: hypothetical protein A2947_02905 [Candidatus Peribacteria bacterium RIFCSPLOWO2_01_FULL_54_110]OGJ70691.1 MAG: hypothetical protein A3H22_01115 [Candidatus Peribacteria bacterium RIFCSPLOWO2_12_FULL_55_15]